MPVPTTPTTPRRPRRTTTRQVAVLVATAAIALSGCGDDDADTATSTTAPAESPSAVDGDGGSTTSAGDGVGADLTAYCEIAVELTEQDSLPTAEQLAEYQSLAPEAVAEPVATLVAAFEAAGDQPQQVFADEEAVAAIEELTAFEAEACGLEPPQDPDVTEIDPSATQVAVTATDHAFDVDLPTAPGRYSFVMANSGVEPHLMVLAHLEDDAVLDEVMASEGGTGVIDSFESGVVPPGAEGVVTAELVPGRWVLICPIPTEEGTTHVDLGMVREFTVS